MNQNYNPQYNNEAFRQNLFYQNKALEERKEIRKLGNIVGIVITVFLISQIISVSFLSSFGLYDVYNASQLFQSCFNTLAIEVLALVIPFGIMAFLNRKKYESELIPTEKLPFGRFCAWVGFGMLCCVGANYAVGILVTVMNTFGFDLVQVETMEPDSLLTCIASIVGTAIVPAVCEEFAMRCCTLGLLKKYGKAFGVTAVSIVFGLLHGNVIQFVFATMVGLAVGFVTVKTNSILPAVFIHAFNNGMSVVSDLFAYALGDRAEEISLYAFFFFWIAAGILSTVYLSFKKQLKRGGWKPKEPFANTVRKKLGAFFFVPGMIVPFIFLIFFTVTTIEKI